MKKFIEQFDLHSDYFETVEINGKTQIIVKNAKIAEIAKTLANNAAPNVSVLNWTNTSQFDSMAHHANNKAIRAYATYRDGRMDIKLDFRAMNTSTVGGVIAWTIPTEVPVFKSLVEVQFVTGTDTNGKVTFESIWVDPNSRNINILGTFTKDTRLIVNLSGFTN